MRLPGQAEFHAAGIRQIKARSASFGDGPGLLKFLNFSLSR